jgi:hypothetical protein
VPVEFFDEFEELEEFDTLGYMAVSVASSGPTYGVSHFEQLCKMSTIADRILLHLYSEKSSGQPPLELYRAAQSLHTDLEQWRQALPQHFTPNCGSSGITGRDGSSLLPHTLSLL